MGKIEDYSPFPSIYERQKVVLRAIDQAYKDGYKNVLLEMAVGGGKSLIAVTASKYYGSAHIITPRKALQDQYHADFKDHDVVLMKGRNAYPCTYSSAKHPTEYNRVKKVIQQGGIIKLDPTSVTCAEGPCKGSPDTFIKCCGGTRGSATHPCPYHLAMEVAEGAETVVHNVHSFIFQTHFGMNFDTRNLLIIDECHEIEDIVREFSSRSFTIPSLVSPENFPPADEVEDLSCWANWLRGFADLLSDRSIGDGVSPREEYLAKVEDLRSVSNIFGKDFVADVERNLVSKNTKITFIPEHVGNMINQTLLQYGRKRLLMSGTIYDFKSFCRDNGLKEEETKYITIGSTFPVDTRPIHLKKKYLVDTSFAKWDANFTKVVKNIREILEVFHDVKGLIHTPSYGVSYQLYEALKDTKRLVVHSKENFHENLDTFFKTKDKPKVFLSPICQQGVDFKYDRAAFQIIIRVPFASTSDTFIDYKRKKNFSWYNYRALIVFGQQLGRINRADDDFGVTILLDERFDKFIRSNIRTLPKWLLEAIKQ